MSPSRMSITSFDVHAHEQELPNNIYVVAGFEVDSGVTLAVQNLTTDSLSAVLDAVTNISRNISIKDIAFGLSPQLTARTRAVAREQAVQNARSNAEAYADVSPLTLSQAI